VFIAMPVLRAATLIAVVPMSADLTLSGPARALSR